MTQTLPPALGNTPSGPSVAPDELKKDGLIWMGKAATRGEQPVIVFYRTLAHRPPFAPKPQNIDPRTGQPKLVNPVDVDLYFPNGPLQGRVYRRVGFISAGWTGPIRDTAVGSINVGQLGVGNGANGEYPQLNALDPDALAWATQIHNAANGDVFAYYSGEPSPPVGQPAQAAPQQPPADRFAGQGVPAPGSATSAPAGPPPGMPGAGGPPPGFGAQQPAQAQQPPAPAQPQPTSGPPPAGVPAMPTSPVGPPPGFPGT
jgi:hypothetical protein